MHRAVSQCIKSFRSIRQPIRCLSTANPTDTAKRFKNLILETVLDEKQYDQYSTIISANGESLLDGFLETSINRTTDRLLVVSNGFDGDKIAKKAFEMGISTDWCFHSTMFSMDPIEAAEDVVNRPRITHALFIHADSFTGSITPIRSILTNVRKVRKDVTICVDNRLSYSLHPLSSTSSIIDYSIHDTSILNTSPSFGFCVCHKPAIMAQANLNPKSLFGSIYNRSMFLEKMMPSLQETYLKQNEDHWTSLLYKYENTKSQFVNKMKLLLPLIPSGADQSCCASAFLVPQEVVSFRELIESLRDIHIPVRYQFITPALPAISFMTKDLIEFEDNGGDLMSIYKCVDRVVRKRSPAYMSNDNLLKNEKEYRTKFIFGDTKWCVC